MFNCKKYENSYMKVVYCRLNNEYESGMVNEIQVKSYPFHTGIRILSTDGFNYFDDIHCKNVFQALKEVKKLIKKYK